MAISEEVIEKLLENYQKPEDVWGENGLIKQLTKGLLEKMLAAELTTHLGLRKARPGGVRQREQPERQQQEASEG